MEKGVLLLVVYLAMYVRSAPIESETVCVKDVTTSLQNEKRKVSDNILPDNLTFQLRGGSRTLTLNLKRNHAINPNANVFFVSKLNDGRSHLEKALNLEEKELAYYQDKTNGIFMTVQCLRRSNGRCDRVITMEDFGHNASMVEFVDGMYKVDVANYLLHQARWTKSYVKLSDHVMLFSKYAMYHCSKSVDSHGYAYVGTVCDPSFKTSLIQSHDYYLTVTTAAHELAHNLGANHDGEGNAFACRADDYFLMTPLDPVFSKSRPYSRNP